MRMFRKNLSFILAVLMIMSCLTVVAFGADGVTVNLRIEGIEECLYYGDVTVAEGSTVLDVLKAADAKDSTLTVTTVSSDFGPYVTAINGITSGSYTAKKWDGWSYQVDGVSPDLGVSAYTVSDNEAIVMFYGDPWNTGMQYPIVDTSGLADGKITVTSMDTVYDPVTWEPTVKECPVANYTLTWGYGSGKTVELTADANGVCVIPEDYLTAGEHTVQVEKYDVVSGLPTVLRLAPDYSVTIEGGFFARIIAFFRNIIETILALLGI